MRRFLVEVYHEIEELAFAHAERAFLASGSHFMTHVDWGCMDGVHADGTSQANS